MTTGIRSERQTIDPSVKIGDGTLLVADDVIIEHDVRIGAGVRIIGSRIVLGSGSVINDGVKVTATEGLTLGAQSVLGTGLLASGRKIDIGEYFWSTSRVVIGGGGWQGPDSTLTVGDGTSLFDGAYVNLSEHVTMGDRCALSADAAILTHGCWQPVLSGFPFAFAPVELEDDVVVYLKSVVLPGVTLRQGTTVAAGSVVGIDSQPFNLIGGVPARLIKEDVRKELDEDSRFLMIVGVLERYAATLDWKGLRVELLPTSDDPRLILHDDEQHVTIAVIQRPLRLAVSGTNSPPVEFNVDHMTVTGDADPIAEDLRDFLRRSGIRFFTGKPFRVLPPRELRRLRALAAGDKP